MTGAATKLLGFAGGYVTVDGLLSAMLPDSLHTAFNSAQGTLGNNELILGIAKIAGGILLQFITLKLDNRRRQRRAAKHKTQSDDKGQN